MTQIQKHEKAVKILTAIEKLETLIMAHKRTLTQFEGQKNVFKIKEHYRERIAIETDKKIKLKNYYEKAFKL